MASCARKSYSDRGEGRASGQHDLHKDKSHLPLAEMDGCSARKWRYSRGPRQVERFRENRQYHLRRGSRREMRETGYHAGNLAQFCSSGANFCSHSNLTHISC